MCLNVWLQPSGLGRNYLTLDIPFHLTANCLALYLNQFNSILHNCKCMFWFDSFSTLEWPQVGNIKKHKPNVVIISSILFHQMFKAISISPHSWRMSYNVWNFLCTKCHMFRSTFLKSHVAMATNSIQV